MKNIAISINIEKELLAIDEGQCGSCRLGLTHKPNKPCYNLKFQKKYKKMQYCNKCNHLYYRFDKCPVCIQ